jgi:hypothetical protein
MSDFKDKAEAVEHFEQHLSMLNKNAIQRELDDEEDSIQDEEDHLFRKYLKKVKQSRYFTRKRKYRKKKKVFDLEDAISENSTRYNDREFRYNFRLSRESFHLLLEEIRDLPHFKSKRTNKQQPVALQLLVYLFRVGKSGSGGSANACSTHFGIGVGSIYAYVRRVVEALLSLSKDVIYWPDKNERNDMKSRLSSTGFRHCVGIIDGTLIVLENKPEKFHECYYSRKSCYALNVMIVCDDQRRITYYYAGWPGSTHDNRVWRNSNLFLNRLKFFSHLEYLLGDSAYSNSIIMVQAFKKRMQTSILPPDQHAFNTALAKVRIVSEHTIGILKARFPAMKRTNIQFKEGKKEIKELVDLIGSCIVIHNLCINYDDKIPQEWYDEIAEQIDWTEYDEDEERIAGINSDGGNRRDSVFRSFLTHFY